MQSNQQERRFSDSPPQQPVYRFPQNQPSQQGWQPQTGFAHAEPIPQQKLSRCEKRALDRAHKRRHRIFTWWNLFAVIGVITVIIQAARYLIIPLLVYLNVLTGGVL